MNLSEHVTLYIQRNTKKGESLADFLLDTMHGRTPYAKFSHQFKAVELLTFYGGFVPDQLPTLDNLPARNDGNSTKRSKKRKVTEKELLNYDIIRMIKQDTRNGEMLVDLLIHVAIEGKMSNSRRFISPSTRMRAAQELLTRGFGAVSPRRIPTGKNEGLGATISKRIRKDTDNGREAAAYLMDIVIGNPPKSKPSKRKRFTPHRRVLAACELLRRLCDIRTDHITPEHIQAYWTSQTPIDARARETHANSRPDINRTGIDKATALAAMAAKPAENNKSAADNDANADKPAVQDPFPLRGKARMGAPTTTDAGETNVDKSTVSDKRDNPINAAISEPSNNAAKPAAQDPFPPNGKARMGATPTADTAETQPDAAKPANDDHDNTAMDGSTETPAAVSKPAAKPAADAAETQAAAALDERDNTAAASKPAAKPAADAETQAAAALDERDNTAAVSKPAAKPAADAAETQTKTASEQSNTANTAETPVVAAAKPAISNPPANATEPSTTNTAIDTETQADAGETQSETTPTTPSRPTAFALNSSLQNPKLTRQQRRQAQRKQKKAQRRAQRKARSP